MKLNFNYIILFAAMIFMILIIQSTPAESLSCPPCNRKTCTKIKKCQYGVVTDICGCCKMCGNGPNTQCGGEFIMYGKCGDGLICRSNDVTAHNSLTAEGTCVYKNPKKIEFKKKEKQARKMHIYNKMLEKNGFAFRKRISNKIHPKTKFLYP